MSCYHASPGTQGHCYTTIFVSNIIKSRPPAWLLLIVQLFQLLILLHLLLLLLLLLPLARYCQNMESAREAVSEVGENNPVILACQKVGLGVEVGAVVGEVE